MILSLITDLPPQLLDLSTLFLPFQFPDPDGPGFARRDPFPAGFPAFLNPEGETLQGVLEVLVLGAVAAPDDDDARWQVLETDG